MSTNFNNYRTGALKRQIRFELTKEHFEYIIRQQCIYCGADPQFEGLMGIDRIDNERGYVIDNCVPCCTHCNQRKGPKTLERFALSSLQRRINRFMKQFGVSYTIVLEE